MNFSGYGQGKIPRKYLKIILSEAENEQILRNQWLTPLFADNVYEHETKAKALIEIVEVGVCGSTGNGGAPISGDRAENNFTVDLRIASLRRILGGKRRNPLT